MPSKARRRVRSVAAIVTGMSLLFLATFSAPSLARPGSETASAAAETLTQQLIRLHTEAGTARRADRAVLNARAAQLVAARRAAFATLMVEAPAEVLRLALPPGFDRAFASSVQETLEREEIVEGELEVLHVDHRDASQDHYEYLLTTAAAQRYSLHFAEAPSEVSSGVRTRLHGVLVKGIGAKGYGRLDGALAVRSGKHDLTLLPAAATTTTAVTATTTAALLTVLPNTFGEQKTLVILVNFADKLTQPYTPDYARNVVFTATSNYDLENSFQQTWLAGDVTPWQTIALNSTVCDSGTLATQAKQAAVNAGYILANYTRFVYAFPDNACTWWGLGSVGGKPSSAWINGSIALKVVGHEMGHNFGLYHAHTLECGAAVLGTACTSNDYGDPIDMMGGSGSGHYNAFEKERMGWLDYGTAPAIATVQAAGVYTLDPYAAAPGVHTKALKILKSTDSTTGKKTWYYLEYRQATGFDSFLSSNANVLNGLLIRTGEESSGNSSYLLDYSPTSPTSFKTPALPIGQSFTDPVSGVTINPSWADGNSAIVNVSYGPLACVHGRPTLTLAPNQSQWLRPGASVSYSAGVTNTDNAGCAAADFTLQTTMPSGWNMVFAPAGLSVPPGASATTTLTITAPTTLVDGLYTFPVNLTHVADPTLSANGSVSVVAAAALGVTVSTDRRVYARGQTIFADAQLTGAGAPVANATISFVLTKANGSRLTVTTSSNSQGTASASFRLSKRDPLGTYQLRVDASTGGGLTGSGLASVTVQ